MKFGYYWIGALIRWHAFVSNYSLNKKIGSSPELLASFVASTREFDLEISRTSARVVTCVSRTRSSMILKCDFAGHASHSHMFVNLRLSATVLGISRDIVPDTSMSFPLSQNTQYRRIPAISQDGPRCIEVCPLILNFLVSWDTRDIPGWSRIHLCLSPYPGILTCSIAEYSEYLGMVPDTSKFFLVCIPRIHVETSIQVSWNTWDIPGWS